MSFRLSNWLLNVLLQIKMLSIKRSLWASLWRKTEDPQTAQNQLLMDILAAKSATSFGQEHRFRDIKSYDDYKKNIAVQSYEDLRPYIEKQEREKTNYLNTSQPIMYVQTSGTTGKPKYIPILKNSVKQYKQSQHVFAHALYEAIPGIFDGKTLSIVSPVIEGKLESGTPVGAMSGLIYQSMPKFLRTKYVVPPDVFEISDYDLKYYLIAAFALATRDITLIATANPSTLLKLEDVIRNNSVELIKDIKTGNHFGLKADPQRAAELAALSFGNSAASFADFWPDLKAVATWTGGNCAALIPRIKKLIPLEAVIIEMGYLSSEFRGSITVDIANNKSIPTIHENFFEFVEHGSIDDEELNFITLDALKKGKKYYIYATTQNGLYRYFIDDIIEVDGWFNNTPTIRFVQKGKGVTNITGEKLYESHVTNALQNIKVELNLSFDFFIMIASPDMFQYSLYIESGFIDDFSKQFEKFVSKLNIEFEAKRNSGRLKKTRIIFLKKGSAELYKRHCLDNGQREGQFKILQLQYANDCSFDFKSHARTEYENN